MMKLFGIFTRKFKIIFLGFTLFLNISYTQDLGFFNFIYPSLVDILKNPPKFVKGFQYEMDNLNPIYRKKYMPIEWKNLVDRKTDDIHINNWRYRFSISVNASGLLFSFFNYSLKGTLLKEDVLIPEIYLAFGHYFYTPTYAALLDEPYKELLNGISSHNFSGVLGVAKSLRRNIKLFSGYRIAYGFMKMKLPDNLPSYITLILNSDVDKSWLLNDIFAGVSYLIPNSNWETLISVAFNPEFLFFGGKLEFLHKYVGLGVGYYSNNTLLPFRPFVRVQYEF